MNIQDLLKLSPEDLVKKIQSGDISDAVVLTLPLDVAFSNKSLNIAGNFISCVASTDVNVSVDLEFNRINNGKTTFTQGLTFIRPFGNIFVTSSAQAGKTITFIISSFAPLFAIQDNRSNALQASYLSTIAAELQGSTTGTDTDDVAVGVTQVTALAANTARKSLCIQADPANTGKIFIGFTTAVATTKKIACLVPGASIMLDDFRGALYAISDTAAQKISASEW